MFVVFCLRESIANIGICTPFYSTMFSKCIIQSIIDYSYLCYPQIYYTIWYVKYCNKLYHMVNKQPKSHGFKTSDYSQPAPACLKSTKAMSKNLLSTIFDMHIFLWSVIERWFSSIFWHDCQNFHFGWPAGYLPLISNIFEIFLRFSNF